MLISNRAHTILLVAILAVGIGVVAMLASGVRGGPLDPPGPPAQTMHTLNQVPPSWSQQLDATGGCSSERFECVLPVLTCNSLCHLVYEAVLDHETGLVWERNPQGTGGGNSWGYAKNVCVRLNLGGRTGWRLSTTPELMSLVDQSVVAPAASLPVGHPFQFSTSDLTLFWTATPSLTDSTKALGVDLVGLSAGFPGAVHAGALQEGVDSGVRWCVRGAVTE